MKMFDPVVIGTDRGALDLAHAIRSALELFRLHVHMYWCVQKRNALDFFAGKVPESEYVVLCCHGLGSSDATIAEEMKMGFCDLSDQVEGKWVGTDFALTPTNIPELVRLGDRTVIAPACGTGREPLARAFLDSGCKAYIAPDGSIDQDSAALFIIAFFYHLLAQERDPSVKWTEREAAELAASFDKHTREGTHLFRYYTREE